jgi:hypothetical protein
VTAEFVPVDSDTIGGSAGDAGMMSGGGGRMSSSELGDKTAPSLPLPLLPLLASALAVGRTMEDGTRLDDEPPAAAFAKATPKPCAADDAADEAEKEANGRRINSMRNKGEMRTLLSRHVSKC